MLYAVTPPKRAGLKIEIPPIVGPPPPRPPPPPGAGAAAPPGVWGAVGVWPTTHVFGLAPRQEAPAGCLCPAPPASVTGTSRFTHTPLMYDDEPQLFRPPCSNGNSEQGLRARAPPPGVFWVIAPTYRYPSSGSAAAPPSMFTPPLAPGAMYVHVC